MGALQIDPGTASQGTRANHRLGDEGLSGHPYGPGAVGFVVIAAVALVVICQGSTSSGAAESSANRSLAAHASGQPGISVVDSALVLNSDGSATLSASLAAHDKEVALIGVDILYRGSVQDVASTGVWLPVAPGSKAIVGAASGAGGFTVASGLETGDVADVHFLFDDRSCVSAEAQIVRRTAQHGAVYPRSGSQLSRIQRLGEVSSDSSDGVRSLCS